MIQPKPTSFRLDSHKVSLERHGANFTILDHCIEAAIVEITCRSGAPVYTSLDSMNDAYFALIMKDEAARTQLWMASMSSLQ